MKRFGGVSYFLPPRPGRCGIAWLASGAGRAEGTAVASAAAKQRVAADGVRAAADPYRWADLIRHY